MDFLDGVSAYVQSHDLALSSVESLSSQTRTYLKFCILFDLTPVPATSSTICRFTSWCAVSGMAYGYIKNLHNAIQHLHTDNGFPHPWLNDKNVKRMRQGLKRTISMEKRLRLPITPAHLIAFNKHRRPGILLDLVFLCAAGVAFHGLLRKDNITSKTLTSFDGRRDLSIGDVVWVAERGMYAIVFKHTKTRQYGDRPLIVWIAPVHDGHPFSAFNLLTELLAALKADSQPASAPLFQRPINGHFNGTPLGHSFFVSLIKTHFERIGINAAPYNGHSFRIGGATTLGALGLGQDAIGPAGDWLSDAFQVYVHAPLQARIDSFFHLASAFTVPALAALHLDHDPLRASTHEDSSTSLETASL